MSKLTVQLGANIRRVRKEKGFSQEGLALKAKIDRSYMGRIERGEVNLTIEILYIIAETIGCEARTLLP
jgi:transcriptional regulator with XRE-family HTH domain